MGIQAKIFESVGLVDRRISLCSSLYLGKELSRNERRSRRMCEGGFHVESDRNSKMRSMWGPQSSEDSAVLAPVVQRLAACPSPPRLILLRIHCSCYGGGGGVVVAVVVSEEVVVAVMVVEEVLAVMVVSLLNAAWQRAINYAFSRRHDKWMSVLKVMHIPFNTSPKL